MSAVAFAALLRTLGGHDLDPRGRQPEHGVECLQILTDIGGRGELMRACRGAGGWGRGKDRHRLAAAIGPLV